MYVHIIVFPPLRADLRVMTNILRVVTILRVLEVLAYDYAVVKACGDTHDLELARVIMRWSKHGVILMI